MLKSEVIDQVPQSNSLITTHLAHPQGREGIFRFKPDTQALKQVTGKGVGCNLRVQNYEEWFSP